MTTRAQVIGAARAMIGVPWKHQGRNLEGVDCGGLVVLVCRQLSITSYDVIGYQRRPDAQRFLGYLTEAGFERIPVDAAQPGDLMAFREGILPCHVGIVSERGGAQHIIHAHATRRKVIEEPLAHEWVARRIAAFAMNGVR